MTPVSEREPGKHGSQSCEQKHATDKASELLFLNWLSLRAASPAWEPAPLRCMPGAEPLPAPFRFPASLHSSFLPPKNPYTSCSSLSVLLALFGGVRGAGGLRLRVALRRDIATVVSEQHQPPMLGAFPRPGKNHAAVCRGLRQYPHLPKCGYWRARAAGLKTHPPLNFACELPMKTAPNACRRAGGFARCRNRTLAQVWTCSPSTYA